MIVALRHWEHKHTHTHTHLASTNAVLLGEDESKRAAQQKVCVKCVRVYAGQFICMGLCVNVCGYVCM